ncbi:hypothetical protein BH24ACT23_BH24ACT23_03170 [soil metagenome]
MDVNNLRTGEKIAGASGIALLLIMFIFDWFSVEGGGLSIGINAWEAFGFIDIVLFLAAAAGIGLAVISASQSQVNLPVAMSALAAGLGGLATVLILFRILSPPDGGAGDLIDVGRSIGVFLGLIAAAGVTYGGWTAMQEEGTSFSDQADRLQGDRSNDPPPPPQSQPPAA